MSWETITNVTSATAGAFDVSSIDFTTHKAHKIIFDNLVPATDNIAPYIALYTSGGLVNSVGAYHYRDVAYADNNNFATVSVSEVNTLGIPLTNLTTNWGIGNNTGEHLSGYMNATNFASNSNHKGGWMFQGYALPGSFWVRHDHWSQFRIPERITGFKIYAPTNSLAYGNITLIGFA